MKKTGLFKIIMWVLLGVIIASWIFSASYYSEDALSELGMYNVGFFDYFQLLFSSFEFSYFIQILILLVSVGALYGVLNKTGKYRALVERIASNFKGAEFVFLIISAFLLAALSSVYDYGFLLFIFIPFLLSVIMAMGYSRITAILSTFGAIIVGTIGNTIGYNTSGIIAEKLGTEIADGVVFRIVLFVLSFAVLGIFLFKAKTSKKMDNEKVDMFLGEKSSNKYSVVPIIVVFSILLVLLVLGCTNWEDTFNTTVFTDLNTTISSFEVKLPYFRITSDGGFETGTESIAIFGKLLGSVSAFGNWYYSEMAVMCFLAALIIGACYRIKMSDRLEYMYNGARKMMKPALLIMLIYAVVYFSANTMFYPTLTAWFLKLSSKFNPILASISVIFASVLHVDGLYVINYAVPQLASLGGDTTVLALITQGMYGVTMFIAPTSAILALGLSYLNVPYTLWIKRTWKITLSLLAVVSLVIAAAMIF